MQRPSLTRSERGWVRGLAAAGLAARGITYLLVAWLVLKIALGQPHHQASDAGAFQTLAAHGWGVVLLLAVGAGLAGYCLWSVWRALDGFRRGRREVAQPAGNHGAERDAARGVGAGAAAVVYGFLAYLAVSLATGGGQGSSGDPSPLAARVMQQPAGRAVVAAAGAGVIVAGAVMVWRAVKTKFCDDLEMGRMGPATRRLVTVVGVLGSAARGLVVALVGLFLLLAGVRHKPGQAKGLDGSLVTLAHRPFGGPILVLVAVGIACFGAFSLLEARYIRT